MKPLLFGPPTRRLFGLYHVPEGATLSGTAVLLCAPMGHEALRSHRFYRVLAIRLARRGMAVLRFDSHGAGDSPGADEDGELEGWRADVGEAHRELLARSGAKRVIWFGARLGASLAVQAASVPGTQVDKLVLWEPVLDGAAYLQALRERHVKELEWSHALPDADWRREMLRDPDAFIDEAFGFAISPVLRSQLLALTSADLTLPAGSEVVVVAKPDDVAAQRWVEREAAAARNARWLPLAHSLIWTSNPFPNNAMVPADALQQIAGELSD
jgi:pimeloyl-ACP methyl ester carboxylesterase